jgi:putative transposase
VSEVYPIVEVLARDEHFAVDHICETLNLSRSAYYHWLQHEPSSREEEDVQLAMSVRTTFYKHKRRYGTRRIRSELADQGSRCGRRRIAKLMKNQKLRAIQPKSFVPKTTQSRHTLGYSPNLLLEEPEPTTINQLWVGDISYIPLRSGVFCFLAMLMDRFSRRIVSWQLEKSMDEGLVLPVLLRAIRQRQASPGLIHHTDRGGQYAGHRYRAVLGRAEFRQSMSRPDNCYDNAFMESCFGTLKTELEMTEYDHQRTARRIIGDFIAYYNLDRKHSALGYLTPHQFETRLLQ